MIMPAYAIVSFTVACAYSFASAARTRFNISWSTAASWALPISGTSRALMYGHDSRVVSFQSWPSAHSSAKSANL